MSLTPPSEDEFGQYLDGTLPADDAERIRAYVAAHPGRQGLVDGVFSAMRGTAADLPDHADARQRFLARFGNEFSPPARRLPALGRTGSASRWSSISPRWGVGLVVAALALAVGLKQGLRTPSSTSGHRYATRMAERSTVTLTDGTRIILAPQTTLQLVDDFGRATRTVTLNGEAYFDVTTSSTAPFVIRTGAVTTRVLGTTFAVRHYADDKDVHVTVQSGKVAVSGKRAPVTVAAGSSILITDSTAVVTANSNTQTVTDWVNGRLVFDETPVPVMLATLSRWYGYKFMLRDSVLASQRASAVFNVSDPAEMMIVLKGTLGVTMTFEGKQVTLVPRKNTFRAPTRRDVGQPSLEMGR